MMPITLPSPPLTRNRNKIEIQKICPPVDKQNLLLTSQNTVLGVSVNSSVKGHNKTLALLNFLNKKGLSAANILIGDSLYRYTVMVRHNCNEKEAESISLNATKEVTETYLTASAFTDSPCQLNFIYTSQIEKHPSFSDLYKNLYTLFETNKDFRVSVLGFATYYLERVSNKSQIERPVPEIFVQYACHYLIEELTILAILNQQGLNTLLYPGVIQTIYDIIVMDNPYLQQLFHNYIFVSLRIKRMP